MDLRQAIRANSISFWVASGAVLILAVLVVFAIINFDRGSRSATTYQNAIIDKTATPVCPGDTLPFHQVANIRYAPSAVMLVETVVNATTGRHVIPEDNPLWYNHLQTGIREGDVNWLVPDLPPDAYQIRRSMTAFGRNTEMFVVLFRVAEGCG